MSRELDVTDVSPTWDVVDVEFTAIPSSLTDGITFVVQVGMNALMLALLPPMRGEITVAFVVAQGTATVMQRTVIFRP